MTAIPCPACGRDSVLVRALDSCVHTDGSANDACWKAITRGDVDLPIDPPLQPNCCPGYLCAHPEWLGLPPHNPDNGAWDRFAAIEIIYDAVRGLPRKTPW